MGTIPMKKVIVTTTISEPTKALQKFLTVSYPEWDVIVVGDKRTPSAMYLDMIGDRFNYITPNEQEDIDQELSNLIGWNSIQRRNFGFILALQQGYDLIASVDDDNIPHDDWGKVLLADSNQKIPVHRMSNFEDEIVVDPLSAYISYGAAYVWHRGYPLQMVRERGFILGQAEFMLADVQANMWDGDLDVDAICKFSGGEINGKLERLDYALTPELFAPFNSQNTIFTRSALKRYCVIPHIGRLDDIWAAYYLEALGVFNVVFYNATVTQERHPHDLIDDMKKEMIGYEHTYSLILDLKKHGPEALFWYLPPSAVKAVKRYQEITKEL
jgi:hypothetical protein